MSQRSDDFRVFVDESTVEICESKEGLYISDLLRFWPFEDGLDFVKGYCKTYGEETF